MRELILKHKVVKAIQICYERSMGNATALRDLIMDEVVGMPAVEGDWTEIFEDNPETFPPVDEDGLSDYILLSFANCPLPCIGQYRVDEGGGAFYVGDYEDEPLNKIGLIVNGWKPYPRSLEED